MEARLESLRKKEQEKGPLKGRAHFCHICRRAFASEEELLSHVEQDHGKQSGRQSFLPFRSALKHAVSTYRMKGGEREIPSVEHLFSSKESRENALNVFKVELMKKKSLRFQVGLNVDMKRFSPEEKEGEDATVRSSPTFTTPKQTLHLSDLSHLSTVLSKVKLDLMDMTSDYANLEGSGWVMEEVNHLDLIFMEGTRTWDGRAGDISLVKLKKYLSSHFYAAGETFTCAPRGRKNACLYDHVTAYFLDTAFFKLPDGGMDRQKLGKKLSKEVIAKGRSDFSLKCNIGFPANMLKLKDFEDANSHLSFRLNIHYYDSVNKSVIPYVLSDKTLSEVQHSIDLLLLDFEDEAPHHVLINDLGLLRTRKPGSEHAPRRRFVCVKCYEPTTRFDSLKKHEETCNPEEPQTMTMPGTDAKKKFTAFWKTVDLPVYGAWDIECAQVKPDREQEDAVGGENRLLQAEQRPVSYALVFLDYKNNIVFERYEQSDENCMELFFQALEDARQHIECLLRRFPYHDLSPLQMYERKRKAKRCYLCREKFPLTVEEEVEVFADCIRVEREAMSDVGAGSGGNLLQDEEVTSTAEKVFLWRQQEWQGTQAMYGEKSKPVPLVDKDGEEIQLICDDLGDEYVKDERLVFGCYDQEEKDEDDGEMDSESVISCGSFESASGQRKKLSKKALYQSLRTARRENYTLFAQREKARVIDHCHYDGRILGVAW